MGNAGLAPRLSSGFSPDSTDSRGTFKEAVKRRRSSFKDVVSVVRRRRSSLTFLGGISIKSFDFGRCYGRGAYGKVLAVKKKGSQEWYAAKVIDKKHAAAIQSDLKHVVTEVTILAKVNSKFIANLHSAFMDQTSMYLIIDLLVAGSLRDHLTIMPAQTEDNSRFYVSNVLAGVRHLHDHQIIHRDLKPDNILITNGGYLKLVDFGASYIGAENHLTCNLKSGTPPYMAPEMFCRGSRHNHLVDIYAVGVILFEVLYKKVPYERGLKQAAPFIEKAKSHRNLKMPAGYEVKFEKLEATTFVPSSGCQNLIHRMMDIRPWKRIGSNGGVKEIFEHTFFEEYDWRSIIDHTMTAPYIPDLLRSAINNQHEDCLDLFGSEEAGREPLTVEQLATFSKLEVIFSKVNDQAKF
jgi:serine/threonine protein kinase